MLRLRLGAETLYALSLVNESWRTYAAEIEQQVEEWAGHSTSGVEKAIGSVASGESVSPRR